MHVLEYLYSRPWVRHMGVHEKFFQSEYSWSRTKLFMFGPIFFWGKGQGPGRLNFGLELANGERMEISSKAESEQVKSA